MSAILGSLGEFGDDESIQNLLEGMVGQLMGKDTLYEPLKELSDKVKTFSTFTSLSAGSSITSSHLISLPMRTSRHSRTLHGIRRNIRVPRKSLPYSRILNTETMIPRYCCTHDRGLFTLLPRYASHRTNTSHLQMQEHMAPPAEIMSELPPGADPSADKTAHRAHTRIAISGHGDLRDAIGGRPPGMMLSGPNMYGGPITGELSPSQSAVSALSPSLPSVGVDQRPLSTFSFATSVNPFAGPSQNPEPTDEELFHAMRNFLSTQDLMTVSKR